MAKKVREIGAITFLGNALRKWGYTTDQDPMIAGAGLYQDFVHHIDPETTYLPQDDMLDLLEKVTVYVTNLPPNTEVTVREAIIAVGGDPSLRSTQYGVRQHLLDTKLLVHVPKSNEGFRRIEYTPSVESTESPELLN